MRTLSLTLGLLLAAATVGCGEHGYHDEAKVGLPEGDAAAGREVFLSHGCTQCHRATGEPDLPVPTSATPGPELGKYQKGWSWGGLARAIVQPEHREQASRLPATRDNPMVERDFADELTVRELSDLLAYLRQLGE